MKSLMTYALLSFLFLNVLQAQIPTNGLVAYYPLDGNARDASGNGNDGVMNGPVPTTDRFGNASSACAFDGQDDLISIAPPNAQNFHFMGDYSIAVWIYANTQKSQSIFLANANVNPPAPYALSLSGIGAYNFRVKTSGSSFGDVINHSSYPTGQWIFLTAMVQNNTMYLYADGVLLAQNSVATGTYSHSNTPILIGSRLQLAGDSFDGKIDNIRVYNRALTQQEINALYNENNVLSSQKLQTEQLEVYPNPTQASIRIKLPSNKELEQLWFSDWTGKTIFSTSNAQDLQAVDVSTLQAGVYLLHVRFADGSMQSSKIIKE